MLASLTAGPGFAESPPVAERIPLAELWVQTSAEHKALCHQAYNAAADNFDNWLPLLERRADGKAYLPGSSKPVAIILDLDETVIDNSGFQAFTIKSNASYTPDLWNAWVQFQTINKAAGAPVDGAVEFLLKVQEMGVTPVYISNRRADQTADTVAVLKNIGLDSEDLEERVLLRQTGKALEEEVHEALQGDSSDPEAVKEGEGEKEARRRLVEQKYDVVAYFGDVYGDFEPFLAMADSTRQKFEQRLESAEGHREQWGRIWYILPNPMYGSWSVGETIPKGQVNQSLNDYGFSVYLRGRRTVK
jgi:acid phosphatase